MNMYSMTLEATVIKFIKNNDPTFRQQIFENLQPIYSKQYIYRIIRKLKTEGKIFEDIRGTLSLRPFDNNNQFEHTGWKLPPDVINGTTSCEILNAYANQDEQLKEFADIIFDNQDRTQQLFFQWVVATILVNTKMFGFHRSEDFHKNRKPVDRKQLQTELDMFKKALDINE